MRRRAKSRQLLTRRGSCAISFSMQFTTKEFIQQLNRTGADVRPLIMALIFAIIFLACCYVAAKGCRGLATSRSEGYGEDLPDHMLMGLPPVWLTPDL